MNKPEKGVQHVSVPQRLEAGGRSFAATGDKAVWTGFGGIPGGTTGLFNPFLATRTNSGWSSTNLLPPAGSLEGGGNVPFQVVAATPDFSSFLTRSGAFVVSPTWTELMRLRPGGLPNRLLYYPDYRENGNQLISGEEIDTTAAIDHAIVVDRSLPPGSQAGQLVDVGSGVKEVLSIMPDGGLSPCGVTTSPNEAGFFNTATGPGGRQSGPDNHWIATSDASRVYFLTPPDQACAEPSSLFVRNREAQTTTEVAAGKAVELIRTSSDGKTALFVTKSSLADDDTNENADIYRWAEGSASTCLTCVVPDADLNLFNPILVSGDFSHVYFISSKQLVPGKGGPGQRSIYSVSAGTIRYVADARLPDESPFSSAEVTLSPDKGSRVSDDGKVLVFRSGRELTGNPVGQCTIPEFRPFEHNCEQLYRFDETSGSLSCLSCVAVGPTNAEIGNDRNFQEQEIDMSADGQTVVFTTPAKLLARDINNAPDIYEWHEGTLSLVTDGATDFPTGNGLPHLVGISPDGSDIFFTVASKDLTGFEQDGLANYYDARVGGGFVPPSPSAHCVEDSCQGPLMAGPVALQQGSASFFGGSKSARPVKRRCNRKQSPRSRRRCRAKRRHVTRHKQHRKVNVVNRGGEHR